jgi:threonine/homoserine/homoserine lactone efflux protein
MGQAIGSTLPLAVGVALSPVPIIAVVLMLTSRRARSNGPAFVIGWLIGLAVIGAIVLSVAGPAGASKSGSPATWVSWVKIVLGAGLLLVAARQFRSRPKDSDEAALPKWMASIDSMKPLPVLGLAALLGGVNPKNLLLAVSAGASIAQTGISGADQAIAYAVFALIGTIGVGAPVVLYFALGERSASMLATLKDWMGRHNAVIMAVLCLVIGVKLIGDAIGGLTS